MKFRRSLLAIANVAALAAPPPGADEPRQMSLEDLLAMPLNQLMEVVVTGAASERGLPRQDAGYAITTVTAPALRELQPLNPADVVRLVPGMWAETTGGVAGPNVDVRGFPTTGDTPWVTLELNGLPIYGVSTISWLDNFSMFRLDDTVQRMEATIGGPAVLWGMGQPGATVNFIEKNGRDNPGGSARVTAGTGDLRRLDGYWGGRIAEGWYASFGGFVRQDEGVRDTQYPADKGYQLVGTLTHDLAGGKVTLYGRSTHDQNAFFTDIPLLSSGSGSSTAISAYPGFNPLTATLYGNATRFVTLDTGPGQSQTLDMAKGRGIDSRILGLDFDRKAGAIEFTDKMSYGSGSAYTARQESGPLPQTLASFIASEAAQANGNPAALTGAGGVLATGGVATLAGTGQVITNLNQEVIGVNVGAIDKQFNSFVNEARLSMPLGDRNTLTAGAYFASYGDTEGDTKGAYQLLQLQNNPQAIQVILNNGVLATSPDGIYAPVSNANAIHMRATNVAGILADEWKVNDRFRLDAGCRLEHNGVDGTGATTAQGDISGNPLALYDYGATYRVPGSTGYHYAGTAHALTVGADYEIRRDFNVFLRGNQGYQFPNFDSIYAGQDTLTHVDQAQGGFKLVGSSYSAYVTCFYSTFVGQPQQQTLVDGTVIDFLLSARTEGVEVEGTVRPLEHFQLAVIGDYMHGLLTAGGPGITGNRVDQQPALQVRFTPSYKIPTRWAFFRVYATWTYVGQRWSDPQNTQSLPAYRTLDLGAVAEFRHGWSVELTGTNVTNTVAITEGNPRVVGSGIGAGNVFLGRPLFGANYQVSLLKRF